MLVVARLTVPRGEHADFVAMAERALGVLATRPGYRSARLGRAVDDPGVWVLVLEWAGVGAYRRTLSAYDVRIAVAPLFARARDEPSAFEVLWSDPDAAVTADLNLRDVPDDT